jgi:hypothetical protein
MLSGLCLTLGHERRMRLSTKGLLWHTRAYATDAGPRLSVQQRTRPSARDHILLLSV